ncbi:hypothetical protein IHE45_11G098000 [Dioscorea alata]|uniref:Uncharacterized protein n=1 Tax=Dioscorea alata TaxID=55571 RepID=A0ACB7V8W5_DIOAL|nr:hypothetical protein IHE45_11G098000 [Dioscorea alata]
MLGLMRFGRKKKQKVKVHAIMNYYCYNNNYSSRRSCEDEDEEWWWRRSASVRQVVWKLRSKWRLSVKRRSGVKFGYDHQSYLQNFDDGFL